MNTGIISIFIVLLVIIGAIITRRATEFLFLGAILCCIVLYGMDTPFKMVEILLEVVGDPDHVWLWLVTGLFGALIYLLRASRGTYGFQKIMSKICTNEKRTMLASFVLGASIFVDDYLNVMTVGVCMKDLYDEKKIPRESLAFMLDSIGAPICVLIPFSTWAVFYSNLFYNEHLISSSYASGFEAYVSAIPFCFYPIIALAVVFLFSLGLFPKIGPMKRAYERVKKTGKVYSDESAKYNLQTEETGGEGNIWDFLVPVIVLVVLTIYSGEMLVGLIFALSVCLVLYIPRKLMSMEKYMDSAIEGFASMVSIYFMLVGAFSLAYMTGQMGLTDTLISFARPVISPKMLPAIAFLLLAVLAFVTGSNWGMSAVVIPILIPLCEALGANTVLTMAAIISGGAFGSHACFYTDATVLASKSACIENMEHALSQWPYVFFSAGISTVLFVLSGFLMV